jgi:transcriptional regulator with XRE-family HTH domain
MGIGERIRLARQVACLSQRELASKVGVSAPAICKYENNQDVPSSRVLIRLAEALSVGVEFFFRPPLVQQIAPTFRKRDSLPKVEEAVVRRTREWLERYLETEQILAQDRRGEISGLEWPQGFPRLVGSHEDVEETASTLREAWDLGQDPIENMTALLEDRGIRVGQVDGHRDFDACTFWAEAGDRLPVIVVRMDLPGDRQRFRLAHELAYLMLEFPPEWDGTAVEQAAHRFAGSFLVPAAAARFELGERRHTLSWYELHMLKHKYGLSMQAWIDRARDLSILSNEEARRLLEPFAALDWSIAKEPGDPLPSEEPTRLERMVMRALSEELIGERRASELLGKPFRKFTQEVAEDHGGLPVGVGGRY